LNHQSIYQHEMFRVLGDLRDEDLEKNPPQKEEIEKMASKNNKGKNKGNSTLEKSAKKFVDKSIPTNK